jgi:hypothetical protein
VSPKRDRNQVNVSSLDNTTIFARTRTKSLKISKGQSESVYRRRSDNTMAKRYQRGDQNRYIEKEQTTQWPKEKAQKDKQRSTKHTYKTKDRVTRIPLKTGGEFRWPGRVGSSCSTSDTRRVNLVTNPVISPERGKDREVETYDIDNDFSVCLTNNLKKNRTLKTIGPLSWL